MNASGVTADAGKRVRTTVVNEDVVTLTLPVDEARTLYTLLSRLRCHDKPGHDEARSRTSDIIYAAFDALGETLQRYDGTEDWSDSYDEGVVSYITGERVTT